MAQLFHKMISNSATAVVTLIPIIISLAINANINPLVIGFTAGLTCLYGFILVVETMPNLLTHSIGANYTKRLSQTWFICNSNNNYCYDFYSFYMVENNRLPIMCGVFYGSF